MEGWLRIMWKSGVTFSTLRLEDLAAALYSPSEVDAHTGVGRGGTWSPRTGRKGPRHIPVRLSDRIKLVEELG